MKKLLALTLAAIVLAAASLASASPNQPEVGNFVTLKLGPETGTFQGAVKSQVKKCVAKRKVVIVRSLGDDKTKVAKGRTNGDGKYLIQTNEESGAWFARVKTLDIGDGYHCAAAKSKTRSAG